MEQRRTLLNVKAPTARFDYYSCNGKWVCILGPNSHPVTVFGKVNLFYGDDLICWLVAACLDDACAAGANSANCITLLPRVPVVHNFMQLVNNVKILTTGKSVTVFFHCENERHNFEPPALWWLQWNMNEVAQTLLNGQSNVSGGAIQRSFKIGKTCDPAQGKLPLYIT